MASHSSQSSLTAIYRLEFLKKKPDWTLARQGGKDTPSDECSKKYDNRNSLKSTNKCTSIDKNATHKRNELPRNQHESKLKPPANYKHSKSPYKNTSSQCKSQDRFQKPIEETLKVKSTRHISTMVFHNQNITNAVSNEKAAKSETCIKNPDETYEIDGNSSIDCNINSQNHAKEKFSKLRNDYLNELGTTTESIPNYSLKQWSNSLEADTKIPEIYSDCLASSLIINDIEDDTVSEESFMLRASNTIHSSELNLLKCGDDLNLAIYEAPVNQANYNPHSLMLMNYEDLKNHIFIEEMLMMRHFSQKQLYENALYAKIAIDNIRSNSARVHFDSTAPVSRGRGYRGRGRGLLEM